VTVHIPGSFFTKASGRTMVPAAWASANSSPHGREVGRMVLSQPDLRKAVAEDRVRFDPPLEGELPEGLAYGSRQMDRYKDQTHSLRHEEEG